MSRSRLFSSLATLALLATACSSKGTSAGAIEMKVSVPKLASQAKLRPEAVGGAPSADLASLQYFIRQISICESLTASGSGYSSATNCVPLYQGDESAFRYDPSGDLTPLAATARGTTSGFIDLMSETSRATLAGTRPLTMSDAHSYSWGTITWAPPVKVAATVPLADAGNLYTHDGVTTAAVMPDGYRDYYTVPSVPMDTGPAELAVALLPNGGNWFKFAAPLVITEDDITNQTTWVLDLVFNPDGIVQGVTYGGGGDPLAVREVDGSGATVRGISVPMLDLAPVPHRATEQALRESYLGDMTIDGSPFQIRLELYSIDSDPLRTVYGVAVKGILTSASTAPPPSVSKISFVGAEPSGLLQFKSWASTPIITEFARGRAVGDTTTAAVLCATNGDPAAQSGGSAIVVDNCPSASIPVTFRLDSIATLSGAIPVAIGVGDAGLDGGLDDSGSTR